MKEKQKAEKELFKCPYCPRKYTSKHYVGAKKHLLMCATKNKNQKKLVNFFKKKK